MRSMLSLYQFSNFRKQGDRGGNSTKTINANKDSAREAPAIPLKIMIQREHLVRVLIHVI